jgi:hypothetical protein
MLWVEGLISSYEVLMCQINAHMSKTGSCGKLTYFLLVKICVQTVGLGPRFTEQYTYIDTDKIDFGVPVLASLGGRHVDDLARAALQRDWLDLDGFT